MFFFSHKGSEQPRWLGLGWKRESSQWGKRIEMQGMEETKINFVRVIILPRTRPQLWAIDYNLLSLWALNLIVKLVTIIYSHFRSFSLMSI